MTDQERISRALNAKRALDDYLDPAFASIVATYSARLEEIASTAPWEAGKITALANAVRITKQVQGQIKALVADGEDAKGNVDRAKKIEKLTPAKRRLLNIGAF